MSFKDLTARAAAAMKPQPEATAKNPPDAEMFEAGYEDPAPKQS